MQNAVERHLAKLQEKAESLHRNERYREAAEVYREMTAVESEDRTLWLWLAMELDVAEDPDGARAALDQVKRLSPEPIHAVQEWTEYLWDVDAFDEAAAYATDELQRDPDNPWLLLNAAMALLYHEQEDEVEAMLPHLVAYHPDEDHSDEWTERLDDLARMWWDLMERRDLADRLWDRVDALLPECKSEDKPERTERVGQIQRLFRGSERRGEADGSGEVEVDEWDILRRLLKSIPLEAGVPDFGGFTKVPVPERTEDEWVEVARTSAPDALAGYAAFLFNERRFHEARDMAQRSLLGRNPAPLAYMVLGHLAAMETDWRSAERSLKEAVRRGPDLQEARLALAATYLAMNQPKAAGKVLEPLRAAREAESGS